MRSRLAAGLPGVLLLSAASTLAMTAGPALGADDVTKATPVERREEISLSEAALRALKNNLDISISRHTKESRLTDIVVEQSKFDPTLSVNGQYNRTVNPLNRPVFGGTGGNLN